jgi:enoyl-CoA hydratase/carnithine racemase
LDKPIVVAVHGAAIGGGTTMLTHCDFIYAGESTKFQMPFINLAVVPEFGSSCSVPARIGHLRAAELILLGGPYDARRAAELGLEMCRPAAYGAKRTSDENTRLKADVHIRPVPDH